MITLQTTYNILSDLRLSPAKIIRLSKAGKNIISSLHAIEIYCPAIAFGIYERRILEALPEGLNIIYLPCSEFFRITAANGRYQWIANAIESCNTTDQLEVCERLILNTYGDMQPELFKMMIAKLKYLHTSL